MLRPGHLILFLLVMIMVAIALIVHLNKRLNDALFQGEHLKSSYRVPSGTVLESLKHATILRTTKGCDKLLLFFHGQCGNCFFYEPLLDLPGSYDIAIVDYPGFGRTELEPTIEHFNCAIDDVVEWVQKVNPSKLIVWGESLGGNAACKFANRCGTDHTILASTFASVNRLVGAPGIVNVLLEDSFDNVKLAKGIKNLTILHSREDTRIPYSHAKTLQMETNCRLITIEGDHATPCLTQEALEFVGECLETKEYKALSNVFLRTKEHYHHMYSILAS